MHSKTAAIFVAGFFAQQVVSFGGSWNDQSPYSCPQNTNNHCSGSQQGGYDWSGLQPGSFSSYGSNQFSGFSCSNSFGKRDVLSKRAFQSKCISGKLDDGPSMSCGSDSAFSINEMQVSSSQDTDVECHYGMSDGSTCTEYHSCSSEGSIIQNTQCGGAKSVTFKPGKNAPPGCSIGVHSVGFHCGTSSSTAAYTPSTSSTAPAYTPSSSSTAPAYTPSSSSTAPAYTPSSSSSVPAYTPPTPSSSSSAACYGGSCSTSSSPASSSSAPCYGSSCSTSSAPVSSSSAPAPPCYGSSCSTSSSPVSSSSAPAPPCYGASCSTSSSPVSSSSAPAPPCYGSSCSSSSSSAPVSSSSAPAPPCYGSSCSSSSAPVSSSSAPAPPCYGSSCSSSSAPVSSSSAAPPCYGSSCSSSSAPASSSSAPCYGGSCSSSSVPAVSSYPASSSSSAAPVSHPTPSCPDLLPKCLKTWLFVTGCKDASDYSCFCGDQQFITKVFGCVSAWGTPSDTSAAASYLMGICAPYVGKNPAIITACPSTVTPSVSAVQTAACTTVVYSSPAVVPATYSTGVSAGWTISGSSYTTSLVTTVTVPQVQFTTATITVAGTTQCSVGLGTGKPSSAPAYTTPPATSAASSVVCNEFKDGQPQCSTVSAAAGTTPATTTAAGSAAPSYGSSAAAISTSFGTSWTASPSASYSAIVPATGAAVKTGSGFAGLILGVLAAMVAL